MCWISICFIVYDEMTARLLTSKKLKNKIFLSNRMFHQINWNILFRAIITKTRFFYTQLYDRRKANDSKYNRSTKTFRRLFRNFWGKTETIRKVVAFFHRFYSKLSKSLEKQDSTNTVFRRSQINRSSWCEYWASGHKLHDKHNKEHKKSDRTVGPMKKPIPLQLHYSCTQESLCDKLKSSVVTLISGNEWFTRECKFTKDRDRRKNHVATSVKSFKWGKKNDVSISQSRCLVFNLC